MTTITLNKPNNFVRHDLEKRLVELDLTVEARRAVLNGDIAVFIGTDTIALKPVDTDLCHATTHMLSTLEDTFLNAKVFKEYNIYKEIEEIENNNCHVYGIIMNYDLYFGYTFDILFVQNGPDDGYDFRADELNSLKEYGELYAYAINTQRPEFSEYGCIYVKKVNNSICRIG